jgi:PAS domain S-box-containing protein
MLERWRAGQPSDFAKAATHQSPARMLEQYPVPAIALADDGNVLFANAAFAAILGCSCDAVTAMGYEDILAALPSEETLVAVARLSADANGRLQHLDGATVFAKMRRSAIRSGHDALAIPSFDELTERLSGLANP